MNQQENVHINLVLMAKAPRTGFVKSRLQKSYSPDQACGIYRHFLFRARTLAETWTQQLVSVSPLVLAYDPPDQPLLWADWRAWTRIPQSGGSLGDRLLAVLKSLASVVGNASIFIGADAPELAVHHLDWACRSLAGSDAVMVPAHDGGYVLIGLRPSAAVLLDGIDWGTEKVAAQTREMARNAGLHLIEATPVADIDTANDVAGLITRLLCSSNASDRALAAGLLEIINR